MIPKELHIDLFKRKLNKSEKKVLFKIKVITFRGAEMFGEERIYLIDVGLFRVNDNTLGPITRYAYYNSDNEVGYKDKHIAHWYYSKPLYQKTIENMFNEIFK